MVAIILSVAALVSAGGYLWASSGGNDPLRYLLKPLTTLLVLGIALSVSAPVSDLYRWLVAAGLLFSLAGDVFLMLPQDLFVWGLVGFLIAHLLYITAYCSRSGLGFTWWLLLPYAAYTAVLLYFLWPAVGAMRVPVIVYGLVLMTMGWQAAEQWLALRDRSALLAMIGALLFLASDSVLAINKFRQPVANQTLIVMTTYWAAQLLIAWSVHIFAPG